MIAVDETATQQLRLRAADGAAFAALARLANVVGMGVVRMPDGGEALAKDAHDGTWFVMAPTGGVLGSGGGYRAGRVSGEDAVGFRLSRDLHVMEAFGAMIRMPSPVLEDGRTLALDVDDADEAIEAREAALSAPAP